MKKLLLKCIALLGAVSVVAACSSGVKRPDGVEQVQLNNPKVKQVQIVLSDSAKALVADNANFSTADLKAVIESQLTEQGLLAKDSTQVLEVTVSSFRSRSAFAAVMFGVMAGNDNIVGSVAIKDASGKVLKEAEISVSYALGGFAGGGTGTRMGWLYQEFAQHAASELSGTASK